MGILRQLGFAGLFLAAVASCANAQISADLRPLAPGSDELVLRWVADASLTGPFDLLRKQLPLGVHVADVWPLDPVADLHVPGFTNGGVLSRADEASGAPGVRVYQLVDAGGGCSNALYVIKHASAVPGAEWFPPIGLALPWRGGVRRVSELFTEHPAMRAVQLAGPGFPLGNRLHQVHRLEDGSLSGGDWLIPAGAAVSVYWNDPGAVVMVGAAEPSPRALPAGGFVTGFQNLSTLSPRLGQPPMSYAEVLCGEAGVDWPDPDGDREPDVECPGPVGPELPGALAGGPYATTQQYDRDLGVFGGRVLVMLPGSPPLAWLGSAAGLDVAADVALLVNINKNDRDPDLPVRAWLPDDLAAPVSCRCPDSDGDGDDDCTEQLFGTDPLDPDSRGPDEDRDGVPDDLDACPAVPDPLQEDSDLDGRGDACDPCPLGDPACEDPDGDGTPAPFDNCPTTPAPSQSDLDHDGVGDACDNCPGLIWTSEADADSDGWGDGCDNCPITSNPDQEDRDADGLGDECDPCPEDFDAVIPVNDADGDGFGDPCDCDPGDPGSWRPPSHVARLTVTHAALGPGVDLTGLVWPSSSWWTGSGTRFDLARGRLESLRFDGLAASASCHRTDLVEPEFVEFEAGSYWYLVRPRNSCAAAPWGTERHGSSLDDDDPCP